MLDELDHIDVAGGMAARKALEKKARSERARDGAAKAQERRTTPRQHPQLA
jgi:hypothetical protein